MRLTMTPGTLVIPTPGWQSHGKVLVSGHPYVIGIVVAVHEEDATLDVVFTTQEGQIEFMTVYRSIVERVT